MCQLATCPPPPLSLSLSLSLPLSHQLFRACYCFSFANLLATLNYLVLVTVVGERVKIEVAILALTIRAFGVNTRARVGLLSKENVISKREHGTCTAPHCCGEAVRARCVRVAYCQRAQLFNSRA